MPRMPKPSPQARSPPDWYATRHLDLGRNPLGTKLIEFKGHIGARRLLDLSRCGHNNTGLPIALARADALARGIVINGLVILIRPSNSTVQNPVIVGPARMPLFEKASTTQRTFPLTFFRSPPRLYGCQGSGLVDFDEEQRKMSTARIAASRRSARTASITTSPKGVDGLAMALVRGGNTLPPRFRSYTRDRRLQAMKSPGDDRAHACSRFGQF